MIEAKNGVEAASLCCTIGPHGCSDVVRKCAVCGFERQELARRKKLPLIKGRNGLRRKCVGLGGAASV